MLGLEILLHSESSDGRPPSLVLEGAQKAFGCQVDLEDWSALKDEPCPLESGMGSAFDQVYPER